MKKDAMIVMASCQKQKRKFGIRTEKRGNRYVMNWAFEVKEDVAAREGFQNNKIKGSVDIDSEYPGCPYCHAQTWFQCGKCSRFVCMDDNQKIVKCPDCGSEGSIEYADEFDLQGGRM